MNNNKRINKICLLILISFILFSFGCKSLNIKEDSTYVDRNSKLYWFIPDGMRADPEIFNIFKWAQEGELPNIKKMMDLGVYGYSIPTFPSHTPTNFATLFTGTYPHTHGVADGPMHIEGRPLNVVSVGGFNSAAKKVDPFWVTQERMYDKNITLLSIPGSTPPELEHGITIKGRWGGWGADFAAINFESKQNLSQRKKQGRSSRLFFFGPELTKYVDSTEIILNQPKSYSPAKKSELESYGQKLFAYVYDSTNDDIKNYDRVSFSFEDGSIISDLRSGEWSDWLPITIYWEFNKEKIPIITEFKIKLIFLEKEGVYRLRLYYNNLNEFVIDPPYLSNEIISNVGPMVDFVDNFPPQLIYYKEDKQTFIEEAHMSLDWHKDATSFIIENYNPDIFIGDIYTSNQMLTSRWWMGYIDPSSKRYGDVTEEERNLLWGEVKSMYRKLDDILGVLLERLEDNTYLVLSSDHGAVPLDKWVRLNNLFSKKGWLSFTIDNVTGEPIIDWDNSKVIYLKMKDVYIHPEGLGGNWTRGQGKDYEELRDEVIKELKLLEDPKTGIKPIVEVYRWENANLLELPKDRVGDLIIANVPGYGWNEEMTEDMEIFSTPLKSGYKQAILPKETKGMWTPFIIVGPGIKEGYELKEPIKHVDQYSTIMFLLNSSIPKIAEGRVLQEILTVG